MNTSNLYADPSALPASEVLTTIEGRLVPLSNGRPGLRTTMPVQVRAAYREEPPNSISENSCNSCLDFISSDETLDRYSEIISPSGWKLDSYHRNPVFQNAHQYGDIIFTLGRALLTEVRAGKLFQRIQFATDVNPMAKIAYGLYRAKFLSAVSVGFIPLRWENGTQETAFRRKFLEQELLEVSAVAIPANPNSLALAVKSGAVEKSDLRDLADLLRLALDHPTAPAPSLSSSGGEGGGEEAAPLTLRAFLRRLHSILRS